MAKESHSGRDNAAKKHGRKENVITAGGIETCNEGFMGNIETSTPFSPTYGNHKRIGSQMLPTKTGGRGGAKVSFRKKLMTGGN